MSFKFEDHTSLILDPGRNIGKCRPDFSLGGEVTPGGCRNFPEDCQNFLDLYEKVGNMTPAKSFMTVKLGEGARVQFPQTVMNTGYAGATIQFETISEVMQFEQFLPENPVSVPTAKGVTKKPTSEAVDEKAPKRYSVFLRLCMTPTTALVFQKKVSDPMLQSFGVNTVSKNIIQDEVPEEYNAEVPNASTKLFKKTRRKKLSPNKETSIDVIKPKEKSCEVYKESPNSSVIHWKRRSQLGEDHELEEDDNYYDNDEEVEEGIGPMDVEVVRMVDHIPDRANQRHTRRSAVLNFTTHRQISPLMIVLYDKPGSIQSVWYDIIDHRTVQYLLIVLYDPRQQMDWDELTRFGTILLMFVLYDTSTLYCTIHLSKADENELKVSDLFTPNSSLTFLLLLTILIMSSSSKRGRLAVGSSSSSSRHSARFLSAKNEEAYHKYKACKITPSKMLNQAALNFEVLNVFASTTFQFLLTLAFSYNSELLLEFLANLTYTIDNTTFHSFVCRQNIKITRADIAHYNGLSTEGPRIHSFLTNDFDWSDVNRYILQNKYQLTYLGEPNNLLIFNTVASFRILFHRGQELEKPIFDEEEGEDASAVAPARSRRHAAPRALAPAYPHDDLIERFDQLQTCLDVNIQEQHQQHETDMQWFGEHFTAIDQRFDTILHNFQPNPPPPPTDQDPSL
ncbi:hypothetical protein MA16_Dca021807 [Dendrobium catenatum]|uniref:Uncharacterized protein n=1 Tax=Dendrobium catenatum TaxID=906689 RepID=A0A2I0VPK3_9ASPA|nr:hypothetical protein MA16_Dca021807 [Dendrobium catenatum]